MRGPGYVETDRLNTRANEILSPTEIMRIILDPKGGAEGKGKKGRRVQESERDEGEGEGEREEEEEEEEFIRRDDR